MAIEIGLALATAGGKLMTELYQITVLKQHNATIVRDIEDFTASLKTDLNVVETKRKTLTDDQAWVVESLKKDLEDAATYLQNCRDRGWIKGYWDAKRTKTELSALRQKLAHNFHVKLFFTSLEVIIDKEKRTDDFLSKLLQLSTFTANRSEDVYSSTNEIKDLLKPLTVRLRKEDERFQQLRAEIRALSTSSEGGNGRSSETEKFLEDILRGLAAEPQTRDDAEYFDPFTCDLMCDPVKCEDGLTYDRFSVFKNNAEVPNKCLVILCDDISLRSRLFEKFRYEDLDKLMWSKRDSYKMEALAVAQDGHFGEALVSLDNVLQWAPNDSECLEMRTKMRDAHRNAALSLAADGQFPDALVMLKTVLKWSPYDTDCFEKYKMVESRLSMTSEDLHGPEMPTSDSQGSWRASSPLWNSSEYRIGAPHPLANGAPENQEKRVHHTPMEKKFRPPPTNVNHTHDRTGTMEHPSSKDRNEAESDYLEISLDVLERKVVRGVMHFSSAQIKEATKDFSVKIAEAGRGAVYYGTIDNQQVAVKKLPDSTPHEAQDFLGQVELLSKICHANVVPLVGYCCEKNHQSLVLDYMPNGTLRKHLYGHDLNPDDKLDWQGRINAALHVARGLEYLHFSCKPPITHHDVKSNNIMLDKNLEAKIIDFGVSHILQEGVTTTILGPVGGTFGYWDPECLESRTLSTKCDVYAFGIVLLELISGCPPSPKLQERAKQATNYRDLSIILDSDIRGIHKDAVWKLIRLARHCIEINREDRPDMKDVVRQLEQSCCESGKERFDHASRENILYTELEPASTVIKWRESLHSPPFYGSWNAETKPSSSEAASGSQHIALLDSRGIKSFSAAQISAATTHSNYRGEAAAEAVYHGAIDGRHVTIKKLSKSAMQKSSDFLEQVEIASRVRHNNVVALVGYCNEKDHQSLVLDYVHRTTLTRCIHARIHDLDADEKLDWKSRVIVALDVARGLEYLHFTCEPAITHHNVRSNNIMIDEISEAKLMEAGLPENLEFSKLNNKYSLTEFRRSTGGAFFYWDREYLGTGSTSPQVDVYAFGVVLLELISGSPPSRKLHERAKLATEKSDLQILLDSDVKGAYNQEALWELVKLAKDCTHTSREERPDMRNVVQRLEQVKVYFGQTGKENSSSKSKTKVATKGTTKRTTKGTTKGTAKDKTRGTTKGPAFQVKEQIDHTRKENSPSKGTSKSPTQSAHQVEEQIDRTQKEHVSSNDHSRGSHSSNVRTTSTSQYSHAQIEIITRDFSEKRGETEVGTIYSGMIETQKVAVKRLLDVHDSKRFSEQVDILSRLCHLNVVSLVGYCYKGDDTILIFDYKPNGTLREHLHGEGLKPNDRLDWQRRINVALDVARGLEYLHSYCKPPITHYDIRSNNIVLDEEFVARIMEFGLTPSYDSDFERSHTHSSTVVFSAARGGFDYSDPE